MNYPFSLDIVKWTVLYQPSLFTDFYCCHFFPKFPISNVFFSNKEQLLHLEYFFFEGKFPSFRNEDKLMKQKYFNVKFFWSIGDLEKKGK